MHGIQRINSGSMVQGLCVNFLLSLLVLLSTIRWELLGPVHTILDVSPWKHIKCFPSTLPWRNLKMQQSTGHFWFVFEENLVREITWLSWPYHFQKAPFPERFSIHIIIFNTKGHILEYTVIFISFFFFPFSKTSYQFLDNHSFTSL